MTVTVRDLRTCFEGMIPPSIVTSSSAGVPNVTHLSQLQVVDDEHLAASNQFFGKTVANLAENPRACVLVIDPDSGVQYRVHLTLEGRETAGPVFDELSSRVDAIAAMTGMTDVFKLRSADIYRVERCEELV